MKIDFKHARGVFEDYLNGYDREDEKIKLKIIHTYGVVKSAREIGHRMHLNEEDQQLAELIALLHDIGRFEQLRLYNSFSPDTMDHAAFGVQLLFEGENPMISRFIEDRSYDELIRVAIARHSDFRLEGIQDERTLFHAKIHFGILLEAPGCGCPWPPQRTILRSLREAERSSQTPGRRAAKDNAPETDESGARETEGLFV